MKRITFALTILFAITLAGCARSCEQFDRDIQMTDRNYSVECYSGGRLIKSYTFKGILNNQTNSDGYYFTIGDTLHEVGGDIIVKSWK